jgi:EAL and modified HD-GYP domain-containing signal transduction protein
MGATAAYETPGATAAPMVARRPVLDRRLRTVGYHLTLAAAAAPTAADLEELGGGRPVFLPAGADGAPPPGLEGAPVVLELAPETVIGGAPPRPDGPPPVVAVHVPTLAGGLAARLPALRASGLLLLAAEVDTADQFEVLRQAGFDLFLGSCYVHPGRDRTAVLPAGSPSALSTLARLQEHGADLERLEEAVRHDAGLTLRLLGYVNSAAVGMRRPIGSVREALLLLGTRAVRQWAMALALAGLEHRPHALMSTALVRARTCELLAAATDPDVAERAFTVGLLSLADALFEVELDRVVAELPLADDVARALLDHHGVAGHVLEQVLAFEAGEFGAPRLEGAAGAATASAYRDAVAWADGLTGPPAAAGGQTSTTTGRTIGRRRSFS